VGWGTRGQWAELDAYIRGAAAVTRHEPLYSLSLHGLLITYPRFVAVLCRLLELLGEVGAVGQ